jgi:hypothetical protein
MRPLMLIGVLLIVGGIAALAVRTFTYTTKEKLVDIGPIHATTDEPHNVYLYPAAGIAAIVVGGALVFLGRRSA